MFGRPARKQEAKKPVKPDDEDMAAGYHWEWVLEQDGSILAIKKMGNWKSATNGVNGGT